MLIQVYGAMVDSIVEAINVYASTLSLHKVIYKLLNIVYVSVRNQRWDKVYRKSCWSIGIQKAVDQLTCL